MTVTGTIHLRSARFFLRDRSRRDEEVAGRAPKVDGLELCSGSTEDATCEFPLRLGFAGSLVVALRLRKSVVVVVVELLIHFLILALKQQFSMNLVEEVGRWTLRSGVRTTRLAVCGLLRTKN